MVYSAAMDSGAYSQHPDLMDNTASELRFSAIDGEVWSEDLNGHGTHVAGTIGAVGNNGLGVAGINWRVKIIPVSVADADGRLEDSSVISGLDYLTAMLRNNSGLKLAAVNMSFIGHDDQTPDMTRIIEAFLNLKNRILYGNIAP